MPAPKPQPFPGFPLAPAGSPDQATTSKMMRSGDERYSHYALLNYLHLPIVTENITKLLNATIGVIQYYKYMNQKHPAYNT